MFALRASKMAQLNGAASIGLARPRSDHFPLPRPNVAKCAKSSDPNWVGLNPHQANFHPPQRAELLQPQMRNQAGAGEAHGRSAPEVHTRPRGQKVRSLEAHRMTGMPFQRPLSEDMSAVCAFESSLGVRKEANLKALADGDQYEICTQTASA
jgi:hypothetical protein